MNAVNGARPSRSRGLSKRYAEIEAVKGGAFEVAPGEVFGFLGPNRAGRTTTTGMLCTLVHPTGGGARAAGHDIVAEREEVRRNIGLVFQDGDALHGGGRVLRPHRDHRPP